MHQPAEAPSFDLTGKVALVTGGNSGIGLGMALAMAEAGADIAVWGTNAAKNDAARAELEKTGRRVLTQLCDVGDEAAVEAAFAETLRVMNLPDVREKMALLGLDLAPGSPEALTSLIQTETTKWATVVKESGAKLD